MTISAISNEASPGYALFGLAAMISGALNLSSEAIWHRLASVMSGGTVETSAIVWTAFLLGSSIGAFMGTKAPRRIWLFELIPALWSISAAAFTATGGLSFDVPAILMALIMLPPAIAIGAHIPVYAILARGPNGNSSARAYGFWHAGGAIGIILLAYLGSGHNLSTQLLGIGLTQLIFAILLRHNLSRILIANVSAAPPTARPTTGSGFQLEHAAILAVAIFAGAWIQAGSAQSFFYSLPLRIVGAGTLTATTIVGACGALLALLPIFRKSRALTTLPLLAVVTAPALITQAGSLASEFFPEANPFQFALKSLAFSTYLMLPLLFTSAWYIEFSRTKAIPFATVMALASLGNAIGILVVTYAGYPFLTGFSLLLALAAFLSQFYRRKPENQSGLLLLALVLALSGYAFHHTNWFNLKDRNAGISSIRGTITGESLEAHRGLSWWAWEKYRTPYGGEFDFITIDGAPSHSVYSGSEFLPPLIGASYFEPAKINNVLIIGIGSGQILRSASAIAKHVDAVEISAAMLTSIDHFADRNDNARYLPNVKIFNDDALSFVKSCGTARTPKAYDMIINTALHPALMGSGNIYTLDMAKLLANCISPDGIYLSFIGRSSGRSLKDYDVFARPLREAFGSVDLMAGVYPMAIAHAHKQTTMRPRWNPGHLSPLDLETITRLSPDFQWWVTGERQGLPSTEPFALPIVTDYQPSDGPQPTIDNGLGESLTNALYLSVNSREQVSSTLLQEIEALAVKPK